MATDLRTETTHAAPTEKIPPLVAGDRLTRDEFLRRYEAMPELKKAELIEGVVYMPSPVSKQHAGPHRKLGTWVGVYDDSTDGVESFDNATTCLDLDNVPQPDVCLRILPECGGQTRDTDADRYIQGGPELAAEVAMSSVSYDLHDKLNAYRRNGVREYIVWRVWENELDWFILRDGRYERLAVVDGLLKSETFPGLWLDVEAMLGGRMDRVHDVLQQGLGSAEHAEFNSRLRQAESGS